MSLAELKRVEVYLLDWVSAIQALIADRIRAGAAGARRGGPAPADDTDLDLRPLREDRPKPRPPKQT
jgi:hypothetical protein